MTLGQKLHQRRESLGLTRLQVARSCGVVESNESLIVLIWQSLVALLLDRQHNIAILNQLWQNSILKKFGKIEYLTIKKKLE